MQDKVTEINPVQKVEFLHCILHQHVLCKSVLKIDVVTKIVNFIRARALNHRQFVALLEEHETEHSNISYHSCPMAHFCEKKGKNIPQFSDEKWMADFAFAVDVTALNTKLTARQGIFCP